MTIKGRNCFFSLGEGHGGERAREWTQLGADGDRWSTQCLSTFCSPNSSLPPDTGSLLTSSGSGLCSQDPGEVNICTVVCLKV